MVNLCNEEKERGSAVFCFPMFDRGIGKGKDFRYGRRVGVTILFLSKRSC